MVKHRINHMVNLAPSPHAPDAMTSDPQTRDRILDAARQALRERGTAGARMQEIADAAGVNKALLHYYFKNKATLAAAVFQREMEGLIGPVTETLASPLPIREKVRRVVELYLDSLSRNPDLPGYVLGELNFHPERVDDLIRSTAHAEPEELTDRILAPLAEQIREEVEAGRMRPMAPEAFTVNLLALCVFPFAARPMVERVFLGGAGFQDFIRDRKRTLPDFFLAGLRP